MYCFEPAEAVRQAIATTSWALVAAKAGSGAEILVIGPKFTFPQLRGDNAQKLAQTFPLKLVK